MDPKLMDEVTFRKLLLIGLGVLIWVEMLRAISQIRHENRVQQTLKSHTLAQADQFAWQREEHAHKCGNCGTVWSHSNASGGNKQAHTCPNCKGRVYDTLQKAA